jgi:hypothetical protein
MGQDKALLSPLTRERWPVLESVNYFSGAFHEGVLPRLMFLLWGRRGGQVLREPTKNIEDLIRIGNYRLSGENSRYDPDRGSFQFPDKSRIIAVNEAFLFQENVICLLLFQVREYSPPAELQSHL